MSIKNDILMQTGTISREKYIKESSDSTFKMKKMNAEVRLQTIFKDFANQISSMKYEFTDSYSYPRENDSAEELIKNKKKLEELKEVLYKKTLESYKEMKYFIDEAFGKKEEEPELDDDYEGEEDEEQN